MKKNIKNIIDATMVTGIILFAFWKLFLVVKYYNDKANNREEIESINIVSTQDTVYTECNCFNCTDHVSGDIPEITIDELCNIDNLDIPEEAPVLGDTIALFPTKEGNIMCYYHKDFPPQYFEGWYIYRIKE